MRIERSIIAMAALSLGLFVAGVARAGETTLQTAAAASGRYFGAALDPGDFDEKRYVRLATEQLGSVTPENQMKWADVEPRRGDFVLGGRRQAGRFRQGARAVDPRP